MNKSKKIILSILVLVIIITGIGTVYIKTKKASAIQLEKLDTWNYIQLDKIIQQNQLKLLENSDEKLSAIITVNTPELALIELKQMGVEPRTISGDIVTVEIHQSKLKDILSNRYVENVKICEQRHTPSLIIPKQESKVVIGLVDVGLNLKYEDYLDSQGNSRIIAIWDQTEPGMNGPYIQGATSGKLYTKDQVEWYLSQKEKSTSKGHGTFTTAIAAGNSYISINKPIKAKLNKSESPIIIVETTKDEGDLIDAIAFIKNQCMIWNLLGVVNLSYGIDNGPHDGSSVLSQALSKMIDSKFLIVTSAGNNNQNYIHANLANKEISELNFTVEDSNTDEISDKGIALSGWYPKNQKNIDITLSSPSGKKYGPIQRGSWSEWDTDFGSITLANGVSDYQKDKKEIKVVIQNIKQNISLKGNWKVSINQKDKDKNSSVDFWVVSNPGYQCRLLDYSDKQENTLSDISLTNNIIAVGGYIIDDNTKEIKQANDSSRGIVNDKFKPDILAPWSVIEMDNGNQSKEVSGSSFSAPFITRIIEYIWGKYPFVTGENISRYLHGKLFIPDKIGYNYKADKGDYEYIPFTWDDIDTYFSEKTKNK